MRAARRKAGGRQPDRVLPPPSIPPGHWAEECQAAPIPRHRQSRTCVVRRRAGLCRAGEVGARLGWLGWLDVFGREPRVDLVDDPGDGADLLVDLASPAEAKPSNGATSTRVTAEQDQLQ